jgi:putative spermidine/putrescine transport system ATP-binding protein
VQIVSAGHTMGRPATSRLEGALREVIYLGDHVRLRVALPGNDEFMVKRPISEAHALPAVGDAVALAWAPEHCRAFAREDVHPS